MKSTLSAIAVLVALVPSLALAGNVIISDPLIETISEPQVNPSDNVSDALGDAVNGGPVYSDPLNDAVLELLDDNGDNVRRGASVRVGAVLKCVVKGTPSEYPDDLRIRNAGLSTLPAGSEVKWKVASAGEAGYVTLSRALRPGATLRVNGALDDGVEAGTACSAKVL
jgi:hypothetical protein